MATYFIDPYKKYYDELISGADDLLGATSALKEASRYLKTNSKHLEQNLNVAVWYELGQAELATATVPLLAEQVKELDGKTIDFFAEAIYNIVNVLLPILGKLKDADEEYEIVKEDLDKLTEPDAVENITGKETSSHKAWRLKKEVLMSRERELIRKCKKLIEDADKELAKIVKTKSYNKLETLEYSEFLDLTAYLRRRRNIAEDENSKLYMLNENNHIASLDRENLLHYGDYYVVDTPFPLIDYYDHIHNSHNKLYQYKENDQRFISRCNEVAFIYAKNMTFNEREDYNLEEALSVGKPGSKISGRSTAFYNPLNTKEDKDRFTIEDQQQFLNKIYDELSEGRPVPIALLGTNTKAGLYGTGQRHWVTVVGFKTSIEEPSQLKPEDLLILDPWDGEIERMDYTDSRIIIQQELNHSAPNSEDAGYRFAGLKEETGLKEAIEIRQEYKDSKKEHID